MEDGTQSSKRAARFRRAFLTLQNVTGVLLSVLVLATGIFVGRNNNQDCATFLERPVIIIGILLLAVSLTGLAASVFYREKLVWVHLIVVFCLVNLLFCLAIFSLEVTNQGYGRTVHGQDQSYKEYRLNQYPKWMRHRVQNPSYWADVKQCLRNTPKICGPGILPAFANNYTIYNVDLQSLSPVQLGCCKPPNDCKYTYLGASQKEEAAEAAAAEEEDSLKTTIHAYTHDCNKWSSLPGHFCYDCDTCRAGQIQSSMAHWHTMAVVYVVLVMIMIVTFAVFACLAF